MIKTLPEEVEAYRDRVWRREPESRIETAVEAEKFIETVGFCATMTDARRPGPSLYVAVCGRRDAHMPRNVQKDPESSATWLLKDELMRRGRVYYAKLTKGRSMFVAPRLVPHFNALWGVSRRDEAKTLSADARAILRVLRKEWEMATADLRKESGVEDRARFTRALDELQRSLLGDDAGLGPALERRRLDPCRLGGLRGAQEPVVRHAPNATRLRPGRLARPVNRGRADRELLRNWRNRLHRAPPGGAPPPARRHGLRARARRIRRARRDGRLPSVRPGRAS